MANRRINNNKKEATTVAKETLATTEVQQEVTENTEATEVAKVSIFTKMGNSIAKVGNGISTTAKKIWASKPVQIGEAILAVRGAIAVVDDVKGILNPDNEDDDYDDEDVDDDDYDDEDEDEEDDSDEE